MNKPNSLRTHLLANVPELKHSPDRLLIFIDQGRIRSTAAAGLSFEYSYTLNLILTDFGGHPDAVAIPLLAWLLVNQPELLANLERGKDAIAFEADVLDEKKVDLSLTLPLTERVIVKRREDGGLDITHADEPQLTEQQDATPMTLYLGGQPLSTWNSPAGTGVALETPQEPRRG